METYDLIILGSGPAGLSASLYATRYKINHIIIGSVAGGMATEAHKVNNFPGFDEISGFELMTKMQNQVKKLGANIIAGEVIDIKKENDIFEITLRNQQKYLAKNIIMAMGAKHKHLNIENEDKFLGKGLAYCVTCDGFFFKNKITAVIGGGNSCLSAVAYLSDIAEKVYVINKNEEFKSESYWMDYIKEKKNVEFYNGYQLTELKGLEKLESVILKKNDKLTELKLDGLFVEIGLVPQNQLFKKLGGDVNEKDQIMVNSDQSTNIKGIWAAGDSTNGSNSFNQIITACAEGVVAVNAVFKSLKSL